MSLRNPKQWELCLHPKSMTGRHLWHLEERLVFNESSGMAKNKGKPQQIICCKTCKQQPPNIHRGAIAERIRRELEEQKEQRRLIRMFKRKQ